VLLIGAGAVSMELCKNLAFGGIKSVTLWDDMPATEGASSVPLYFPTETNFKGSMVISI
jgi:hypothetical protein